MVVALLAVATPASAQPASESARLFEEGRALVKDGKYDQALDRFTRSYELGHAPGTELNLADCHEHLGQLAEAWRLFDDAAQQFKTAGDASRAEFARRRADLLLPRLGTVVLDLADPAAAGLTVTIAGRSVAPAPRVEQRVDPGSIEIRAELPGRPAFASSQSVGAGATIELHVPPFAIVAPPPVPPPPLPTMTAHREPRDAPPVDRRRPRVIAAYALGGIGGASLVTGVIMGLTARSDYQGAIDDHTCMMVGSVLECTPGGSHTVRSAGSLADLGTGFSVAGIALGAAGVIVYATAPKATVVVPTFSGGAAGLAVSGHF
ncbi:MAG TPA: hypothetical protein VLX92_21225 [Kofleriaceae bacterium]|nr:hypothetical protein [Kofleriaceae bacterium]